MCDAKEQEFTKSVNKTIYHLHLVAGVYCVVLILASSKKEN